MQGRADNIAARAELREHPDAPTAAVGHSPTAAAPAAVGPHAGVKPDGDAPSGSGTGVAADPRAVASVAAAGVSRPAISPLPPEPGGDEPPGTDADPITDPAGTLTASFRILPPEVERDITLLIALGLVLFLNLSFVAASFDLIPLGQAPDPDREKERRGQVEKSEVVTVELVEEPDPESRSKLSRIGADAPPAPPAEEQPPAEETPPAEQQQPQPDKAQVERPEPKPAKPERQRSEPRDPGRELSIADFDVTMDAYKEAVERAEARRKLTPQQRAAEQQRIGGAAPQGTQSAYSKSVTTALAKNKPRTYLTRGEVYIRFQLNRDGSIQYIRVLQSSGDPLMDQTGIEAIRKTTFPPAPPDVDPRDLSYTIHFVFS